MRQPAFADADYPTTYARRAGRPAAGSSLGRLLGRVPATLKAASTTQLVVGGALLALGVTWLTTRPRRQAAYGANSTAATTLDELLLFVNDRIAGYERAVAESQNPELRGYYKQLVSQSQQFATDLNGYLTREGGRRESGTTLKGKLYRAWMDTQAALTGHDEAAILAANLHGEEWALKAYQDALRDDTLRGPVRQAVERQCRLSQQTHERLQHLAKKTA